MTNSIRTLTTNLLTRHRRSVSARSSMSTWTPSTHRSSRWTTQTSERRLDAPLAGESVHDLDLAFLKVDEAVDGLAGLDEERARRVTATVPSARSAATCESASGTRCIWFRSRPIVSKVKLSIA